MFLTNNGWIDKNGLFIVVNDGEYHQTIATNIILNENLQIHFLIKNKNIKVSPSEFLESFGYIRVQKDSKNITISNIWVKTMNFKQKETIISLCEKYNINFNDVVKKY